MKDNILDKWIMARLNRLVLDVSKAMDNYELDKAVRPIGDFTDDLSNWYLRRSRERFKGSDKKNAEKTLKEVLLTFSRVLAPFAPFVAEAIYRELGGEKASACGEFVESVHLEDWPEANEKLIDKKLLEQMAKARQDVSVGLDLRLKAGIKVRQPLASFETPNKFDKEIAVLIKDELNVKEVKVGKEYKLDTEITSELKEEGMFRELTRAVQDLRRKKGLVPRDEIELIMETDKDGEKFIKKFEREIKKAASIKSMKFSENNGTEMKINELSFKVAIL